MGARHHAPEWTGSEIAVLKRHYPGGGWKACAPYLPRRTDYAIRSAAAELLIRRIGGRGRRPKS